MSTLAVKTDERVSAVSFDLDRLIVDLMDGRTIAVPLLGIRACSKRLRNNVPIGKWLALVMGFTGPRLTKT